MNYRKQRVSLLFILAFGLTAVNAQNSLVVNEKGGIKTSALIEKISKLTFLNGSMTVFKTDGNNQQYAISNVLSMNFAVLHTGILPAKKINDIKYTLFPVPVTDLLHIRKETSGSNSVLINIIDICGEVVYKQTNSPIDESTTIQINTSQLPPGLYLCRLKNGNSIETIKFVKSSQK